MPWTGGRRDANHAPLPARSEAGSGGSGIGLWAAVVAAATAAMTVGGAVAASTGNDIDGIVLEAFGADAVISSGGGAQTRNKRMRDIFGGAKGETGYVVVSTRLHQTARITQAGKPERSQMHQASSTNARHSHYGIIAFEPRDCSREARICYTQLEYESVQRSC